MTGSQSHGICSKKALYQFLDKEGYGWVVEGGDVFCAMLQEANAKAAKSKEKSGKGTVPTNVADYDAKDLQKAFATTTSIQLELLANRKTVLGAHHADHDKLGMKEDDLAAAHAVLDGKRLMLVNRTVVRGLYDAVYSNASETPATTMLSMRERRGVHQFNVCDLLVLCSGLLQGIRQHGALRCLPQRHLP